MNILCIEKQAQLTSRLGEIFPFDQVFHVSQLSDLSGFGEADLICFDLRGGKELFSEGFLNPLLRAKKKAVIYEDAGDLSAFEGQMLYGEYVFIPVQKLISLKDFFPDLPPRQSLKVFSAPPVGSSSFLLKSFSDLFRQAADGEFSPLKTLKTVLEMIGVSRAVLFKEENRIFKWTGMIGFEDLKVKQYLFRKGHPLLELLTYEQQFVGVSDSIGEIRNPDEAVESLLKNMKMTVAFVFSSRGENYLLFLGCKDSGYIYSPEDLRYVKQMMELFGEKPVVKDRSEVPSAAMPAEAPSKAEVPSPSREGRDYFREFSYRTTNELKNALVSIKTFIQLFPEKYKDVNFRNDFYQVILQEVARLENISDTLGFFGGECVPNLKKCKMISLAEEAWNECVKQFPKIRKTHLRSAAPEFVFEGDERLLKRALLALLTNAAEAMQGNGLIDFSWSSETHGRLGDWLEIRIQDSGPGIDPENESRVYEPFYSTKPNGLGLGLTFASKIIEAHGGTLVLNRGPQGGTLASVSLPLNLKALSSDLSKPLKKENLNA